MRKHNRSTTLLGIALIGVLAGLWLHGKTPRETPPTQSSLEGDVTTPLESGASVAQAPTSTPTLRNSASHGVTIKQAYEAHDLTVGAKLAELANHSDDRNARRLAATLAWDCRSLKAMLGLSNADQLYKQFPGRRSALEFLDRQCKDAYDNPSLDAAVVDASGHRGTRDMYLEADLANVLDTLADSHFPENDAVLKAAADFVVTHQDSWSANAVVNLLARSKTDINIPVHLNSSLDRWKLFGIALRLLQCDAGMDCGPWSQMVLTQCMGAGDCNPMQSYEAQLTPLLLSTIEFRDVQALRAYLNRLRVSS